MQAFKGIIARIDCGDSDTYADVYVYDNAWIGATHYERVRMREVLEEALQRYSVHLISADTGEPLDVNGGAR